jgi:hypothetical protein
VEIAKKSIIGTRKTKATKSLTTLKRHVKKKKNRRAPIRPGTVRYKGKCL